MQRRIDEIPAEAVEHDVHALPISGVVEGVDEIQRARRGDVFGVDAQIVEHVLFVRVSGGENLCTEVPGERNGGLTDTSGARVDEHSLSSR